MTAHEHMMHGGMMHSMMNAMMGGGIVVMVVWLLTAVLLLTTLVLAVIGLTPSLGRPQEATKGADDAFDVLRRRFARGEIDEREFQERRTVLGS